MTPTPDTPAGEASTAEAPAPDDALVQECAERYVLDDPEESTMACVKAFAPLRDLLAERTKERDRDRKHIVALTRKLAEAEATIIKERACRAMNCEYTDEGVKICRNLHEKGDDCEWEYMVPQQERDSLARKLEAIQKIIGA